MRRDAENLEGCMREGGITALYVHDREVGQQCERVGRTLTTHEVMEYAGLSGDFNQLHTDDQFAKTSPFGRRIAHGVLVVATMTGLTQRLGLFDGTALGPS